MLSTEALRSLAACYRDDRDAQKRVDNPNQLRADMAFVDSAADCIDRLRGEIEQERDNYWTLRNAIESELFDAGVDDFGNLEAHKDWSMRLKDALAKTQKE